MGTRTSGSAVGARASLLLHVQARGSVRDDQENCLASREAVQKPAFPSHEVMAWALEDCRKLGEVSGRRLLLPLAAQGDVAEARLAACETDCCR